MWEIKESGYKKENIIHFGNKFLTGHLKIGVRGTLDEYRKEQLVAINLPLIYDQVGDGWREPINGFNPLYTTIKVDGVKLDVLNQEPKTNEQSLDLKTGLMSRLSVFEIAGKTVTIQSKRFVSAVDERMIIGTFEVSCSQKAKIEISTGVDLDIWDIYGPHIKNVKVVNEDYIYVKGITHEKGYEISLIKYIKPQFISRVDQYQDHEMVLNQYMIEANALEVYKFEQYAIFGVDQKRVSLESLLEDIKKDGFDLRYQKHQYIWYQKWFDADVEVEGNLEAQLALRYSIYQLLLLSPHDYEGASIPARGISGQTYKGAIFWDTEIFMLPFFLNTDLVSARRIIEYRIEGLNGAKNKAKHYGFKGAFYAWESQEDGYDACTDYNVTDVFTKRLVRTYFKDKQVHISGDIIYALNQYIDRTNDYNILKDGALEVLLEVARFYLDYGHYSVLKDRFEVWDVMGPDEYHERVHNNAFTNQLVSMVFESCFKYESYFKSSKDSYFDDLVQALDFTKELELIHQYKDKVYLKEISDKGIIEQFDGYELLKVIDKEELFKQKLHEHEYLGGHGLAGDTKIIKQADVIAMLYLFKDKYSVDVLKNNFVYYEPKTEHGSSLSASMYAFVACMIDMSAYAYPLFMKSATVDLTGVSKHYAGGIYIGGTHPAASGGAYMTAIYGFSGLSIKDEKIILHPHLPKEIESLKYRIKLHGKQYEIFVNHDGSKIKEITK